MRRIAHNLDRWLRRTWPVIVTASLGTAAYLQATAVSDLLAGQLREPVVPPPALSHPVRASAREGPEAVSEQVLRRNPFDSETGPLDAASLAHRRELAAAAEPSVAPAIDPLAAPRCEFGWVVLIATSEDPTWSFAAIEQPGKDAMLRRVGHPVGDHTVEHIARDRVWVADGTGLCQMRLGDRPPRGKAKPKARAAGRRARSGRGAMPDSIAKHIHPAGENHVVVDRMVMDSILEQRVSLFRGLRVRPKQDDGVTVGMVVSRVKAGSLLHALGVRSGDMVKSINGFSLTSPQQALEAYGRLRSADRLVVDLERGGKALALDVDIR